MSYVTCSLLICSPTLFAALLCKIAALRSFSLDKLQYWRESASGISSLAHFLAKDTLDLFNTIIKPLVYLSMFYFFNNPRSSFTDNYVVLVCLVYCVTGMAYALAIYLQPAPAQLVHTLNLQCQLISCDVGLRHYIFFLSNRHSCFGLLGVIYSAQLLIIWSENKKLILLNYIVIPLLAVVSASSCSFDAHCKPR